MTGKKPKRGGVAAGFHQQGVSEGPGFRAKVSLSPTMGCKGTSNSKSLQLKDTPLKIVPFAIGGTVLVSEVTGQLALLLPLRVFGKGASLTVCVTGNLTGEVANHNRRF